MLRLAKGRLAMTLTMEREPLDLLKKNGRRNLFFQDEQVSKRFVLSSTPTQCSDEFHSSNLQFDRLGM